MFKLQLLLVLKFILLHHHSEAFLSSPTTTTTSSSTSTCNHRIIIYKHNNVNKDTNNKGLDALCHHHDDTITEEATTTTTSTMSHDDVTQRRDFLSKLTSTVSTMTGIVFMNPFYSHADEVPTTTVPTTTSNRINTIEMKTFIDPKGLFAINVPKRYFAIRRTVKGDLPDENTGQGRRGSSIFTAGDMAKAEVVAIERFPTKVLLEEEGITPSGDLSTFPTIGNPTAIANLIALRRDRDKQTQSRTIVIPNSVSVSSDGKILYFSLSQSIDVQKPELLLEQMGVSELVRITLAKATLESNDGQMMAVFASALQQDFEGEDGPALEESVRSFVAVDQSKNL